MAAHVHKDVGDKEQLERVLSHERRKDQRALELGVGGVGGVETEAKPDENRLDENDDAVTAAQSRRRLMMPFMERVYMLEYDRRGTRVSWAGFARHLLADVGGHGARAEVGAAGCRARAARRRWP